MNARCCRAAPARQKMLSARAQQRQRRSITLQYLPLRQITFLLGLHTCAPTREQNLGPISIQSKQHTRQTGREEEIPAGGAATRACTDYHIYWRRLRLGPSRSQAENRLRRSVGGSGASPFNPLCRPTLLDTLSILNHTWIKESVFFSLFIG